MQIGFAEERIDFFRDIDLLGYGDRDKGAVGINDELFIRCLRIEKGYYLVCDLLGISEEICNEIKEISGCTKDESIVISCTHTHSGPAALFTKTVTELNRNFIEMLVEKCCNVISLTKKETLEVVCEYRNVKISGVAYDRIMAKEYKLKEKECEKKIEGNTLIFRNAHTQKIEVILLHLACHPVCFPSKERNYSKDYLHYVQNKIQNEYMTKKIIFWNGCCGNINPIQRGSRKAAKYTGRLIAKQIIKGINNTKPNVFTKVQYSKVCETKINFNNKINDEYLKKTEQELMQKILFSTDETNKRRLERDVVWLKREKNKAYLEGYSNGVVCHITIVKMEKIILVFVPFEMSFEFELNINEKVTDLKVLCVCYSDGMFGYLLHEKYYEKNIYENVQAYRFYGQPDRFSRNAMNKLMKCVLVNID